MRITQTMMAQNTLNNIESNMSRINQLEGQITSSSKITRPSDDPVGAARALNFQAGIDSATQYLTNIDQASAWLNTADAALSGVTQAVQRARELAVQAASDTTSANDRQAIVSEVAQLQQHVLGLAQSKYGASFLFSGTRSDAPGYVQANPSSVAGAYQGNTQPILREVSAGVSMDVHVDGPGTFDNVFSAFNNLQTALASNNASTIQGTLTNMDSALTSVLSSRAQIGAKTNRLDLLQSQTSAVQTNLSGLLSSVKDVDMASAITNFSSAQVVYQASLKAGAQAVQSSLLDYLR